MQALDGILALFRQLRHADDAVQQAMASLLRRYYLFLKSFPHHGTRDLRLRRHRDGDGRIRLLAWTRRIRATLRIGNRTIRVVRPLPGRLRSAWIYRIAKDWAHRQAYYEFEKERRTLVALRHEIVKIRRALRLGLLHKWACHAGPDDLSQAGQVVAAIAATLSGRDLHPVAGAILLARETSRLEENIGCVVDEYRVAFRHRTEVSFEPALTTRPNGRLRLSWGFPQTLHTPYGSRRITDHIRGRPTDLWMRRHGLPARTRKEVAAFIRRLLPLERRYGEVAAFLGRHRRRVNELAARVGRLLAPVPHPHAYIPASGHPSYMVGKGVSDHRSPAHRSMPGR